MKEYILVLAPPGVSLGNVVNRLKEELDAEAKDIEEEIKENPETEKALEGIMATFKPPINMETITHNLPRTQISKLWKDAVARCLRSLYKSNKPVKILSGHLVYYSGKRKEFYSVIQSKYFFLAGRRQFRPAYILWIVDDIYDMYIRLPDLYSPDQIESFLMKLARDMDIDIKSLSKEQLAFITMEWEAKNLLHLLSWRHIEPIIAENLALQLSAKFLAWPIKQLTESLKLWLKSQSIPIYISHPISEPRNARNETGSWPEFTKEINSLQEIFSKQGITLVMPTGIDELRFEVKNKQYTGYLQDRWPLLCENNKLLYVRPDNTTDASYNTLLLPKYWNFQECRLSQLKPHEYDETLKCQISAILQLLIREIESQIASRDFLFIYNTKGLLVFRPYYARKPRPTFSGGVDAEIRLWEDIVQLEPQKHIAFIHFEDDVKFMLDSKRDEIWEEFVDILWELLRREYIIKRDVVENMAQNKGNIREMEGILNRADIAQKDINRLKESFSINWRQGKIELLKKYLINSVDVKEELIGVWVLKDFKSAIDESSNIANFLRKAIPSSNKWKEQIDNIFPDSLIVKGT